jgi:pyruvate/2-oxoglutarate dehydrogenase complex dihydrolipoamide dehydrogenase (E3) component
MTKHPFEYDLVTIGAGSGGVRASRIAARNGARVAVIEMPFSFVASQKGGGCGGTCVPLVGLLTASYSSAERGLLVSLATKM